MPNVTSTLLPGQIYRHERFYLCRETGVFKPKFLLILAITPGEDIVARLLTSRAHGRRETPPCFHGMPYPAFYLGVLGGTLSSKSWLDLRGLGDLDGIDFAGKQKRGQIALAGSLGAPAMVPALECAANADDTTRLQERCIRDVLSRMQR